MDSPDSTDLESTTTPFLLKLFCRTGTFHRFAQLPIHPSLSALTNTPNTSPDEFASTSSLPPHLAIHTHMAATLLELAHHIASLQPSALPSPAIGTRLSFRLIYPDTASGYSTRLPPDQAVPPRRFLCKDLGSLVLGEGGPGVDVQDGVGLDGDKHNDATTPAQQQQHPSFLPSSSLSAREISSAATKTLADAKFVVGDYLSVAVLPPDGATGAVAPASVAESGGRVGASRRIGSGLASAAAPGPGRRDSGFPLGPTRGRGRGWRGGSEREWEGASHGRGRERDHGLGFPEGEWRRGERLPEGPRAGRRGSRW